MLTYLASAKSAVVVFTASPVTSG